MPDQWTPRYCCNYYQTHVERDVAVPELISDMLLFDKFVQQSCVQGRNWSIVCCQSIGERSPGVSIHAVQHRLSVSRSFRRHHSSATPFLRKYCANVQEGLFKLYFVDVSSWRGLAVGH